MCTCFNNNNFNFNFFDLIVPNYIPIWNQPLSSLGKELPHPRGSDSLYPYNNRSTHEPATVTNINSTIPVSARPAIALRPSMILCHLGWFGVTIWYVFDQVHPSTDIFTQCAVITQRGLTVVSNRINYPILPD
jgi:hypothetical protein